MKKLIPFEMVLRTEQTRDVKKSSVALVEKTVGP